MRRAARLPPTLHRALRFTACVALCAGTAVALAACGLKGPLYVPAPPPRPAATPAPAPAGQPAATDDDPKPSR